MQRVRARESLRKKVMATCRACAEAGCVDCTCRSAEPAPPDATGDLALGD